MRRIAVTLVMVSVLLSTFAAFSARAQGTTTSIDMQNFAFNPSPITITAGTTITWTNRDRASHTTTTASPSNQALNWDSGLLNQGQSFSFTFNTPGTYNYLCIPHSTFMKGSIVVLPAGQAQPSPTATPSVSPTAIPRTVPDMSQFGFATVGASQTIPIDQAATLTAGSQSARVDSGSFTAPVRFDLLVGDTAAWQRTLNDPSQTVIAAFAFRALNTTSNQLEGRPAKPIVYTLNDPRVNANAVVWLTSGTNPAAVTKLPATGTTITGTTLSQGFTGTSNGWFVTVPAAGRPPTVGDRQISTPVLMALIAGGLLLIGSGAFAMRFRRV